MGAYVSNAVLDQAEQEVASEEVLERVGSGYEEEERMKVEAVLSDLIDAFGPDDPDVVAMAWEIRTTPPGEVLRRLGMASLPLALPPEPALAAPALRPEAGPRAGPALPQAAFPCVARNSRWRPSADSDEVEKLLVSLAETFPEDEEVELFAQSVCECASAKEARAKLERCLDYWGPSQAREKDEALRAARGRGGRRRRGCK